MIIVASAKGELNLPADMLAVIWLFLKEESNCWEKTAGIIGK